MYEPYEDYFETEVEFECSKCEHYNELEVLIDAGDSRPFIDCENCGKGNFVRVSLPEPPCRCGSRCRC